MERHCPKIHLQAFEFNEVFRVAGTLPQKKSAKELVPAKIPRSFVDVHVGTWISLDKREGPEPRLS